MKNISVKLLITALCSLFIVNSGYAQSLQEVLSAVRAERNQVSAENKQREARFSADRNSQATELANVKRQVINARNQTDALETQKENFDKLIAELQLELNDKQGEFGELFGAARSAADEVAKNLENSIISSQYPNRAEALYDIAQSEQLPTIEQFETLWISIIQEIASQSEVVTYESDIIGVDNTSSKETVTRAGPFVAFQGDKFLEFKGSGSDKKLSVLSRQPNASKRDAASNLEKSDGSKYVQGIIDPSLGTILGLTVQKPSLSETIAQGKFVGQIIIWLAIATAVIGIVKIIMLSLTGMAVAGQARKRTGSNSNPLGRVFMAYESNKSSDVETLSLKLDDAILRELPKLNSFIDIIKVVAAVAPLLGLLGTVIGMINTFQAITLYGTGDPQIMAGGISEALVTTVLGLCAAIPLLIIHAFASGLSQSVGEVLESQAAGMIAEHAEKA